MEWIDEQVGYFEAGEQAMADAMLDRDCHPYMIVRTINKQRALPADFGEANRNPAAGLPCVRSPLGGWRAGERDLARRMLSYCHPDVVTEAIIEMRKADEAA